jgi:hypothetical protein
MQSTGIFPSKIKEVIGNTLMWSPGVSTFGMKMGVSFFSACRQLFKYSDPLEAEARACEEGLKLALELSDKKIMMES